MSFDQTNRSLKIKTPLGENELLLTSFSGREEISRLFHFHLDLLSPKENLTPQQLVGKPITVSVHTGAEHGNLRFFHGHVARFVAGHWDSKNRFRQYRIELVPWLWFLTRNIRQLAFRVRNHNQGTSSMRYCRNRFLESQ